jgi:hypothetical protein
MVLAIGIEDPLAIPVDGLQRCRSGKEHRVVLLGRPDEMVRGCEHTRMVVLCLRDRLGKILDRPRVWPLTDVPCVLGESALGAKRKPPRQHGACLLTFGINCRMGARDTGPLIPPRSTCCRPLTARNSMLARRRFF